jgi:hypothetical protein
MRTGHGPTGSAYYGPSAQVARWDYHNFYGSNPSLAGLTPDTAPAGRLPHGSSGLWASARCPGISQRALYQISLIPIDPAAHGPTRALVGAATNWGEEQDP